MVNNFADKHMLALQASATDSNAQPHRANEYIQQYKSEKNTFFRFNPCLVCSYRLALMQFACLLSG